MVGDATQVALHDALLNHLFNWKTSKEIGRFGDGWYGSPPSACTACPMLCSTTSLCPFDMLALLLLMGCAHCGPCRYVCGCAAVVLRLCCAWVCPGRAPGSRAARPWGTVCAATSPRGVHLPGHPQQPAVPRPARGRDLQPRSGSTTCAP